MADTLSKKQRSLLMSKIKSKDTTPEKVVRSLLHRLGYRFRLHRKDLPGKPDIVLPKYKTIIDVRGCFWHCHEGCKVSHMPNSNKSYWHTKLNKNVERDRINKQKLEELGWTVIVIWECETQDLKALSETLKNIKEK